MQLRSADPAPTRAQWEALARSSLKDVSPDTLISRTPDGITIEPLYDAGNAPARHAALARAGAEGGWDVRGQVAHPDPVRANAAVLEALAGGCASVLLKIDPDGRNGCVVTAAEDLARVLDGVMLEAAPIALDAGFLGPLAAEWLAVQAKDSPTAGLALHMDPLGAFAETGESPGPIAAHLSHAAETGARLARTYPDASLMLASGGAIHEAGGSAAQELGVMAGAVVAYARALTAAGLPVGDAFRRTVLGVRVDVDCLVSIAKLRAAREIGARLAAACGVSAPARIEARSSRRMLTAMDPWTNLLRLTVAGFAGAIGGADAVVLSAFTDALGRPAALARRLARNTQLILLEESGLGRVQDPVAGAWTVEALTDQLARQGWAFFQAIERQGGIVSALQSGFVASQVADIRQAREADIAEGRQPVLGVSLYPDLDPASVELDETDPAGFARPAPAIALPGPDSRCPPLCPIRLAQTAELVVADMSA